MTHWQQDWHAFNHDWLLLFTHAFFFIEFAFVLFFFFVFLFKDIIKWRNWDITLSFLSERTNLSTSGALLTASQTWLGGPMIPWVRCCPNNRVWIRGTPHRQLHQRYEHEFLKLKSDLDCGKLMAEYFPGYTLKDYLAGRPIPDRRSSIRG